MDDVIVPGDGEDTTYRVCEICQQALVLSPKNFKRTPGTQHTYQRICIPCNKLARQRKKLAKIESGALDSFMERAANGGATVPHTAELLESILTMFGGTNGFASMMLKQFFDAPPGSRMRTSIMEMILRLATKNTEQGGAKKPVTLMSDEELEEAINDRLQQAVMTFNGERLINVSTQPLVESDPNYRRHHTVPTGGIEDVAGRIGVSEDRVAEALQSLALPAGVSRLPG